MNIEIISLISILVAMAALIIFAMRGWPVYAFATVAGLIVILGSRMPFMATLTGTFFAGLGGFIGSNFLLYISTSFFAMLLVDAGATRVLAYQMVKLIERVKPERKIFTTLVISAGFAGLLSAGGISIVSMMFLMLAIQKDMFEKMDIPWHFYMTGPAFTSSLFMTMVPGVPGIVNLLPTTILGTTPMAAPILGTVCAIICLVLELGYLWIVSEKARKEGEGFLPTGAAMAKSGMVADELTEDSIPNIPVWLCLLPSVIMIVFMNVIKIGTIPAIFVGCLATAVFFFKRIPSIPTTFGKSATQAFGVVAVIAMLVGFGSVVAASPGYAVVIDALDAIPGPPAFRIFISINIAAGLTGSASGGLVLGLNLLADRFLAMGLPAPVIHRLSTISCGGLDSLPHAGATHASLEISRLNMKQGYKHIWWTCTVIPLIVGLFAVILVSIGLVF